MKKKIAGLLLTACVCLYSGCGGKNEMVPVSALDACSDGEDVMEDGGESEAEMPQLLAGFSVTVEGREYELPADFEKFSAGGWTCRGDPEQMVDARSYLDGETFVKDSHELTVCLLNSGSEALPAEKCRVAGVRISAEMSDEHPLRAELPGGIAMLSSGEEDAEKVYGEPADRYEGEDRVILTYAGGASRSVQLGFDQESGVLITLDMINIEETEETVPADEGGARGGKLYREPEKPGNTLADAVVRFGGDLYRLPAPVETFEKNGWSVGLQESEKSVEGGEYGSAVLKRDGAEFYTVVRNESGETADVKDCLVTMVSCTPDSGIPLVLAGGITLGMKEMDFLKTVEDAEREEGYQKEENADVYTFYRTDAQLDYTEVKVDEATRRICGLKVVCNRDAELEKQILNGE